MLQSVFFPFNTNSRADRAMSRRLESIPYPRVWRRFVGKKELDDGTPIRYRIQDVTEDMVEDVVEFLLKYFITESPIPKLLKMSHDPVATKFLRQFWRDTMAQKISIVALVDNENSDLKNKLVGVNLLHFALKGEKKPDIPYHKTSILCGEVCIRNPPYKAVPQVDQSQALKIWFGFIDYISALFDPFEYYGVDAHLWARGLSVDPNFRGESIGLELLKGRLDIGKELGLKVSVTLFSNIASQKVALKAGFEDVAEVVYDNYQVDGKPIFKGLETKTGKLMAARIM